MQEQKSSIFRRDVLLGVLGSVILAIGIGAFIIGWRNSDSLESTKPEAISNDDIEIIVSQTVAAIVAELAGEPPIPTAKITVVASSTLTPTPSSSATATPTPTTYASPIPSRAPPLVEPTITGGGVDNIGRLAFSSNGDIYVVNDDGSEEVNLTNSEVKDYLPSWSPDGKQLAFWTQIDGNSEIYVINIDGAGLTNLTNNSENDQYPVWSPDGTKIAFNRSPGKLFVMNADGTEQTHLSSRIDRHGGRPAWSANSQKLAYWGYGGVNVINADGSGEKEIDDSADTIATDPGFSWSPVDNRIVALLHMDGKDDLYVVNTDNWERIRLTDDSTSEGPMTWSPDGQYIAFIKLGDVFLTLSDGSGQSVNLTNGSSDSCDRALAWSPDGINIACVGGASIYLLRTDGSNMSLLTNKRWDPFYDFGPVWQPLVPAHSEPLTSTSASIPTSEPPTPTSTSTPTVVSKPAGGENGRIAFNTFSGDIYVANTAATEVINITNSEVYSQFVDLKTTFANWGTKAV